MLLGFHCTVRLSVFVVALQLMVMLHCAVCALRA